MTRGAASSGETLPGGLREAVLLLRDVPRPDEHWRRAVLHAASSPRSAAGGAGAAGVWTVRPMAALAAGVMCALVGAGATALLVRQPPRSAPQVAGAVVAPAEVARVRFALDAPAATAVHIVGDFNAWNPEALPLRRSDDGRTWEVEIPLAPGRYAYSFLVDGALAADPRAPRAIDDDFGTPNSIVLVSGS